LGHLAHRGDMAPCLAVALYQGRGELYASCGT
jgi:hypothetical protein